MEMKITTDVVHAEQRKLKARWAFEAEQDPKILGDFDLVTELLKEELCEPTLMPVIKPKKYRSIDDD